MSINEPRPFHVADDWAVVIQSVPSKSKKEIVKRLEEIFELDKRDAVQILSSVPLMFLDNLSFGLAVRVKKYFQKLGAVTETTNHDVIKKNCMQVLWPQAPDLSYFMKNELGPTETSVHPSKGELSSERKPFAGEKKAEPETPKIPKGPPFAEQEPEMSRPPLYPPIIPKPFRESKDNPSLSSAPAEKPKPPSLSSPEADVRRSNEALDEKIRKIDLEKQLLQTQHAAMIETMKQQIEAEKKKTAEITRAYENLQKEARKEAGAFQQIEEWRAKIVAMEEKIRQLEQELSQKKTALEPKGEAQDLRAEALEEKIRSLENELTQKSSEFEKTLRHKESVLQQLEAAVSQSHQEIANLRSREQGYVQRIEGLEKNLHQMTESLRYRDRVLAEFEKQITELAKITLSSDAGPAEDAH